MYTLICTQNDIYFSVSCRYFYGKNTTLTCSFLYINYTDTYQPICDTNIILKFI